MILAGELLFRGVLTAGIVSPGRRKRPAAPLPGGRRPEDTPLRRLVIAPPARDGDFPLF